MSLDHVISRSNLTHYAVGYMIAQRHLGEIEEHFKQIKIGDRMCNKTRLASNVNNLIPDE